MVLAVAMPLMAPGPGEDVREAPEAALVVVPDAGDDGAEGPQEAGSPADRIETSRLVTLTMGLLLGLYLVLFFLENGFMLTLDIVNWTFLALVLLVVGNARELAALVARGGRTVVEGAAAVPALRRDRGDDERERACCDAQRRDRGASRPRGTLGVLAFLSAGLVNVFVPSGGGQFALQAPIFATAAEQLGGLAAGRDHGDRLRRPVDQHDPAVLGGPAAGGGGPAVVRDILGYTSVVLVITGVVFAGTLLLVGAG